jgi:hypothetical protein
LKHAMNQKEICNNVDRQALKDVLTMENISMPLDAGHIITPRWHKCGGFEDTYDWNKPIKEQNV